MISQNFSKERVPQKERTRSLPFTIKALDLPIIFAYFYFNSIRTPFSCMILSGDDLVSRKYITILRPAQKSYFLKIEISILASVPAFCVESIRAAATTTTSQTIMSRKKCVVLFGGIYEYSFQEEEGSLSSFLKLNPRDLNP